MLQIVRLIWENKKKEKELLLLFLIELSEFNFYKSTSDQKEQNKFIF